MGSPWKSAVGRRVRSDPENFATFSFISLGKCGATPRTPSADPTETQPRRPHFARAQRDRSCGHAGTDDERDEVIRVPFHNPHSSGRRIETG
jgi:hypothetical protein